MYLISELLKNCSGFKISKGEGNCLEITVTRRLAFDYIGQVINETIGINFESSASISSGIVNNTIYLLKENVLYQDDPFERIHISLI